MSIIIWQMFTIIILIFFVLGTWISLNRGLESLDKKEAVHWEICARRVGTAKGSIRKKLMKKCQLSDEILLGENIYFIGNRFKDEIYIDDSGERLLLYANIQKEKVYLTVLKGVMKISNHFYEADKTKRIEIKDRMKISFSDVELEFIKKGVAC